MNTNNIVFTRYLYLLDDARLALVGAILERDKERALFWAYEIYFSGFYQETITTLWECYYNFYAIDHSTIETTIAKKQSAVAEDADRELFVSTFVLTLVFRQHNIDVFLLHELGNRVSFEEEAGVSFSQFLVSRDFEMIAQHIANNTPTKKACQDLSKKAQTYFQEMGIAKTPLLRKLTHPDIAPRHLLLVRIMQYYASLARTTAAAQAAANDAVTKKEKKVLIVTGTPDLAKKYSSDNEALYATTELRKRLNVMNLPTPNTSDYVGLVKPKQHADALTAFRANWMVLCITHTPLWKNRFTSYGAHVDNGVLKWSSDDKEEEFYEKYWYDQDEWSKKDQERHIPPITTTSLADFVAHKHSGLYTPDNAILIQCNA